MSLESLGNALRAFSKASMASGAWLTLMKYSPICPAIGVSTSGAFIIGLAVWRSAAALNQL